MSGFLKFIVHLIVFLSIISVLALAVPPFVGISTVTIDDADIETNLPLGSVTYGKTIAGSDVRIGDSIVVQEGTQIYRYRVQEIDLDNSMYTVVDTSKNTEPKAITLRGDVTRVTITIGYIGYLLMAIQSREGLIVIGLGVLFLIILFTLAEIWGKDKEDPDDPQKDASPETPAPAAPIQDSGEKTPRQLKKEARALQKAEVARLKAEAKERRREEKERLRAAKKIARTGGFIEDMEPVESILGLDGTSPAEQAADQAHEELKKEVEAAAITAQTAEQEAAQEKSPTQEIPSLDRSAVKTEDSPEGPEDERTDTEDMPKEDTPQAEAPQPEQEPETTKIAIPLYTAEELLEKARSAGEAPGVVEDADTGVTLLDYSSIIGGKEKEDA